ncbi:MAG TPA: hypothetical protein VIY48_03240, partial [Candidatus Paceibacterota bacterium]
MSDSTDGGRTGRRGIDYEDRNAVPQEGLDAHYAPAGSAPMLTASDIAKMNSMFGTQFSSPMDYMNYLYGPGGSVVGSTNPAQWQGQYYTPPTGKATGDFVNKPIWSSVDSPGALQSGLWAPLAVAGLGLMAGGLGGAAAGSGDLGSLATATDMAGGSLAAPELAGSAYAGLGGTGAGALGAEVPWYQGLTDAAGGSLADPVAAGSAYAGLGDAAPGLGSIVSQALSGAQTATSAGGLLSKALGLTGGAGTAVDALGRALPGLLGAYASNQQNNSYTDLANKYMDMGAPYRDQLRGLMSDPSSFLKSPQVTVPVQQGTDIMAHSLSTTGNPSGSGNALQQLQSYATDQLYGKLGQQTDRLANYGGLSNFNAAAPAAQTNAIGSQGNTY